MFCMAGFKIVCAPGRHNVGDPITKNKFRFWQFYSVLFLSITKGKKVKLLLSLIKHYAMKAYGGVDV
jgi:hypothetical protein